MGRKKNLTETELENTQTTLTIEDANQAEAEEAELLAEDSSELDAKSDESIEIESEVAEVEPKKPRRSRKKKEAVEASEEVKAEEIVEEMVESEEVKKPRRSRAKKEIEVSGPQPLTTEIDQWAAIKQLSEQVALILEKNSEIKPNAPQVDIDNLSFLKPQQPEPKTLFVTKFAVAASIVAVLLSVVSLSLSQSARQAALSSMDPMKQSGIAINPKRLK